MKILVLSYYYHPDLSAGSFRATSLVNELIKTMPEGTCVDVLTTLPNRYESYSVNTEALETSPGLTIRRMNIASHKGGMLEQSRNFAQYAYQVMKAVKGKDYDLVFATSSRLMTAILATWVAKRKNSKLYLDIRDIFVDTMKDILPSSLSWPVNYIFSKLEKWVVKSADKINLVSPGFYNYFFTRFPDKNFSFFTNGIEDHFITPFQHEKKIPAINKKKKLKVLYAGNIGNGQGLSKIIPSLSKKMEGRIDFEIYGDGNERVQLQKCLEENQISNVTIHPPVSQQDLRERYIDADVLFLHLNDYDAFKKVIPSKLFEYGATGKPIWAGLAGYPAEFARSEIMNCAIFHPCHTDEGVEAFNQLKLEMVDRTDFKTKYHRQKISLDFAKDILSLL